VRPPDLVVIAASAGGLQPLFEVLSSLPADFPAAIAVVSHRSSESPELLARLLASRTALRVRDARDGDVLEAGVVYVCPPGAHMTTSHSVRVVPGPKVQHVRPSADLMLGAAVQTHGDRVVGVVLSGMGTDGAIGCDLLRAAGASVVVQDPSTCEHADMPSAALAQGGLSVPPDQIGDVLVKLLAERVARAPTIRVLLVDDHRILLDGLRTLLERERDIEVVAEAEDGHAAVWLARNLEPDVVVMDIAMPRLDGIEAIRMIKEYRPTTRILTLTAFSDGPLTTSARMAGALGTLDKNAAYEELARAIRAVAAGRTYPAD
jgi:two-component system, chemotaxis family, protein-glutamate methylesterase/glutaminase